MDGAHTCRVCGTTFTRDPGWWSSETCSDECATVFMRGLRRHPKREVISIVGRGEDWWAMQWWDIQLECGHRLAVFAHDPDCPWLHCNECPVEA